MNWYAAHIVMYVRFRQGPQDPHYVQENIVIVQANDPAAARQLAEQKARRDYEGDSEGSFTCDGRSATWEFAGVRMCVECEDPDAPLTSGKEITYLEYRLQSGADLSRLVSGESVVVEYDQA